MTDKAWIEGMREFQAVGMPGWPYDDETISSERARAYRRHLDVLTDLQWDHAVREAIRYCKWFPTVHELLDFGEAFRPGCKELGPARTPEQRQRDHQAAVAGLELIRQKCAEVGLELPRANGLLVELTDERRRELRDLAETVSAATEGK